MAWTCPQCRGKNDDRNSECACGYAFYKILGTRPDDGPDIVNQAYRNLCKIWREENFTGDQRKLRNARERMRKIDEAYAVYRHFTGTEGLPKKKKNILIIGTAAGVALVFIVAALLFWPSKETLKPVLQPQQVPPTTRQPAAPSGPETGKDVPSAGGQPQVQTAARQDDLPADMGTEDKAIELVKRSKTADPNVTVETVVKRWTEENAGKIQVSGWSARLIEAQLYQVSFVAMEGDNTKGFYFDVDLNTRVVRDIGHYPELQKKYGIKY